jgi:hypothetical protein
VLSSVVITMRILPIHRKLPSTPALGQTRVTILLTSSIHAAPWVVICAAK